MIVALPGLFSYPFLRILFFSLFRINVDVDEMLQLEKYKDLC